MMHMTFRQQPSNYEEASPFIFELLEISPVNIYTHKI